MADYTCSEFQTVSAGKADRIYYPSVSSCVTVTFLLYNHTWKSRHLGGAPETFGRMVGGHINSFDKKLNDVSGFTSARDYLQGSMFGDVAAESRMIKTVAFIGAITGEEAAMYNLDGLRRLINARFWSRPNFVKYDTKDWEYAYMVFDGPSETVIIRGRNQGQTEIKGINDVVTNPTRTIRFDDLEAL